MNTKQHNKKLKGKTFIFKIGNYKAFGGAETQSFILAKHLKCFLAVFSIPNTNKL